MSLVEYRDNKVVRVRKVTTASSKADRKYAKSTMKKKRDNGDKKTKNKKLQVSKKIKKKKIYETETAEHPNTAKTRRAPRKSALNRSTPGRISPTPTFLTEIKEVSETALSTISDDDAAKPCLFDIPGLASFSQLTLTPGNPKSTETLFKAKAGINILSDRSIKSEGSQFKFEFENLDKDLGGVGCGQEVAGSSLKALCG